MNRSAMDTVPSLTQKYDNSIFEGQSVSIVSDFSLKRSILDVQNLDELIVEIISLRVADPSLVNNYYMIMVHFKNKLLLSSVISSVSARNRDTDKYVIANGLMYYNPSDYVLMCSFADHPLTVQIMPISNDCYEANLNRKFAINAFGKNLMNVSCCNIDILPVFLDEDKLCVQKRMQPLMTPPVHEQESWDNLPLITLQISANRKPQNVAHHQLLRTANYMKLTLIGCYNLTEDNVQYAAASRMPMENQAKTVPVFYEKGRRSTTRFRDMNFIPKWESLRTTSEIAFSQGDEKLMYKPKDILVSGGLASMNVDVVPYMRQTRNKMIWGSFHRSLLLENSDEWLWNHLRRYKWPVEVVLFGDDYAYSMMGFLDLFSLLYPGEDSVLIAVPLMWTNVEEFTGQCLFNTGFNMSEMGTSRSMKSRTKHMTDKVASVGGNSGLTGTSSDRTTTATLISNIPTGADGNFAFVLVHVKMKRPLRAVIPPPIVNEMELNEMLKKLEEQNPQERNCTGRGQLDRDWKNIIQIAANSLKKIPYYGATDICAFNRQLSETRTRIEMTTSFWREAAIYVNNNFVVQDYVNSNDTFEEMLMMAHACLLKVAWETLFGVKKCIIDPILRAARHARCHQDAPHAADLYIQYVGENTGNADIWRELSTCLKDEDHMSALVTLHESVYLNPRHPLTLVSMGCMAFDKNIDEAEPFFEAILALYPLWTTGLIIVHLYYIQRQFYHYAEAILNAAKSIAKMPSDSMQQHNFDADRTWESELNDWWDPTPLLPGMSPFYDTADFLLRLRALSLAKVSIAKAVIESGESPAYYHLVALCCRLEGDNENALCHVRTGITKFGDLTYLKSLEAECLYAMGDDAAARAAFEKIDSVGSYSILLSLPSRMLHRTRPLLVDLIRRQPNAYAWMALADDWLMHGMKREVVTINTNEEKITASTCATASAIQALRLDRRATGAWALLSKYVKPRAWRAYCRTMARACGLKLEELKSSSETSLCYRVGKAILKCHCGLCENRNRQQI